MKRFRIIMLVVIGIICIAALSYADIPRVLNYQGKFTDKDNNPLSGNHLVTFRFYDVPAAGSSLWEEGHILTVQSGRFNVLLGSIKPLDVSFDRDLWLGIEVASDGEMTPRIKLASSAYAMNAQAIDMISSTQLVRNDVDSIMSGSLTLRKDLILKGDIAGPSRIVLTDAQGREYYMWMDNSGNLRLKEGLPSSNKDGSVLVKEGGGIISSRFVQSITQILLLISILIIALILYSIKKK
ncbi:MAG: hypothetical protein QGI05_03275 [Candidatus Omnitrophota bacterium]|nr:hypothetical protein [Candidatus Omnitrophota bacterium]